MESTKPGKPGGKLPPPVRSLSCSSSCVPAESKWRGRPLLQARPTPTMMEPAGRCGTRRLPAAGAAPPVDSSGSNRKVGWRKVGRRPRHWWGRLQGFGPGWRPLWASSTPGSSLLLLCFLLLGLRTNKLLPCPSIRVRGQEVPMVAQTPVATRLSGCIGKIGWLDLLH